ncbi:MAG: hypothetical protein ABTS16_17730, partial [Candidatus Accumulibacter phosphatis]|nr:hypothetical protein [Accumulibacter sp.]
MSVLDQKIRIGILATPVVLTAVLVSISLAAINSLGKDSLREKGSSLAVVTAETVKAGVQYGVFDDAEKLLTQLIANDGDVSASAIVVQDGKGMAGEKVKNFAKGYENADLAGAVKALLAAPPAKKGEPVFLGEGEPQFIAARIDLTANDQIQSGFLIVALNSKRISADINKIFLVMIGAGGGLLVLGAIISLMISRAIMNSIGGEPAYVRDVMRQVAGGDLTVQIQTRAGDNDSLAFAIGQTVSRLAEVIGEVRSAADNLTGASGQVSNTAQLLSQLASEQAALVEETTASMEEMSASIVQNTENARRTDGMASTAARQAVEGGEAVARTVEAMKSIADRIGIIDDIAYQTNLLALNA